MFFENGTAHVLLGMVLHRYLKLPLVTAFLALVGCATTQYETHYAIFEAENSQGDSRLFRVYWQTVRYEGWSGESYRALPLIMETQCSERALTFYDASYGEALGCEDQVGEGIHFCGRSAQDETRRGLPIKDYQVCGTVTDRQGHKRLLELEGELLITMHCQPIKKEELVSGNKVNMDYLMSSSLPYIVSTKTVSGRDVAKVIPEVSQHSSICDPDY